MSYEEPPVPSKASLVKWWKAFTKNSEDASGNGNSVDGQGNGLNVPSTRNKRSGSGSAAAIANALGLGGSLLNHHGPESSGDVSGLLTPAPYHPPRDIQGNDGKERVFGVSLDRSLTYASVAISIEDPQGAVSVWGYVPIVVAKCGMMLKETAVTTEGIFRVSGSSKRINQLQAAFDSPPRYGKDLDWTGYSVHDVASVLRRYLNMMPDPVIPQDLYSDFTSALKKERPLSQSIADYKQLISLLPPSSRYLLLYLLDFLSVFARSSSGNLMTASNLAVVFQPGLVSSRKEAGLGLTGAGSEKVDESVVLGRQSSSQGAISGPIPISIPTKATTNNGENLTASASNVGIPGKLGEGSGAKAKEGAGEHGRGKEVLEFLIEQQSHFILGVDYPVPGKAKKEKKKKKKEHRNSKEGKPTHTSNSVDASSPSSAPPLASSSATAVLIPGSSSVDSQSDAQGRNINTNIISQNASSMDDSGYGRINADLGSRTAKEPEREKDFVKGHLGVSARLPAGPVSLPMQDRSVSAPGAGCQNGIRDTGPASPDLSRRGSEKGAERRRLRKLRQNQENELMGTNGLGKVKRSRTLPGTASWRRRGSAGQTPPAAFQLSTSIEDDDDLLADAVPSRKYFVPIPIPPGLNPTPSPSPSRSHKSLDREEYEAPASLVVPLNKITPSSSEQHETVVAPLDAKVSKHDHSKGLLKQSEAENSQHSSVNA